MTFDELRLVMQQWRRLTLPKTIVCHSDHVESMRAMVEGLGMATKVSVVGSRFVPETSTLVMTDEWKSPFPLPITEV
jgi:hypothetical protein